MADAEERKVDELRPGNVVPGESIPVKLGLFGQTYDIPLIRCECGGDAVPVDSSYDAQRDTITYICPNCGRTTDQRVH